MGRMTFLISRLGGEEGERVRLGGDKGGDHSQDTNLINYK